MDASGTGLESSSSGGPGGDGGKPTPPIARKRKRIELACMICRKKKLGCSGGNPCTNCRMLREVCSYAKPLKVPKPERPQGRKRKSSPDPLASVSEPKHKKRKADASSSAPAEPDVDEQPGEAPHQPITDDVQQLLDDILAIPSPIAGLFGMGLASGATPFDTLPTSLPSNPVPPSFFDGPALSGTDGYSPVYHSQPNPVFIESSYTHDTPIAMPTASLSSGTPMIAGIPFFPSTVAGRAVSDPSYFSLSDNGCLDYSSSSNPLDFTGSSVTANPSDLDDITLYSLDRDITEDEWLNMILQLGEDTVTDILGTVPVLFPYQDPVASVNPAPFPDDVQPLDDAYSDPSVYTVIRYPGPFPTQDAALSPFHEDMLDLFDLVGMVDHRVGLSSLV